jgi:hypothetical protein
LRCIKTLIIILLISLKKSRRDNFNYIKKSCHNNLTSKNGWWFIFLTVNVTHSDNHWLSFLMLLDLFYRGFSNNIKNIIIKALMCFKIFFFLSSHFFYPINIFLLNITILKSNIVFSNINYIILLKKSLLYYFTNIF